MKKSIYKHKISVLIFAILFSAGGYYGCNESSTNPTQSDNLSFSSTSSTDSIGDSQNILILDTVKILIKDIKLNVANNNQDSVNFKVGPYVLFLDLTSGVTTISSAIIPAGEYQKIKFEIHKLNNNEPPPDPEFTEGYSVIVKGWYTGSYFIYKSTKSAHQILNFPTAVPISLASATNITLVVRPYIWFISNGVYLDPTVAANSNDIDNNIKNNVNNNFRAFRDNDRNGVPD